MQQSSTLKRLQTIHKAMLTGLLFFAAIAVFLQYRGYITSSLAGEDQLFQVIAVVISFSGFFAGTSIFKKKVQQARDSAITIQEKAAIYRSACILQWALLEGPALFCIICFMLVGNYAFIALAAALMLWFALTAPSKMKSMLLLRINEEEMEQF